MKKFLYLALLASIMFPLQAEWFNMKTLKVAVLDVVSRVPNEKIDTTTLTEMLQVALVDRNEFQIVERALLEKIIKEQELQISGLTDGQAAKIGSLSGAHKVMLVSLAKLSDKYIFIVKGIDSNSGIVDLSDQVMSHTIDGFIEVFPVLADRLIRKARGETLQAFTIGTKPTTTPGQSGMINITGVGGTYKVTGTNPDGSVYQGSCIIEPLADGSFTFTWSVGSVYKGTGKLSNNILTVEWGDVHPVIYVVNESGTMLEGTWNNGTARESLSK